MPSNVLPSYVRAENKSAECHGFTALSTLLTNQNIIVQRTDLTCDVIRKVTPFVSFEYSLLIGQCAGHVTRLLLNYDFVI